MLTLTVKFFALAVVRQKLVVAKTFTAWMCTHGISLNVGGCCFRNIWNRPIELIELNTLHFCRETKIFHRLKTLMRFIWLLSSFLKKKSNFSASDYYFLFNTLVKRTLVKGDFFYLDYIE